MTIHTFKIKVNETIEPRMLFELSRAHAFFRGGVAKRQSDRDEALPLLVVPMWNLGVDMSL